MVYNINFSYHIFQRNHQQYDVCGDSYFVDQREDYAICVVADGLGSGPHAHDSAQIVTNVVQTYGHQPLDQLMLLCNERLKLKRGAVASVMRIHFARQEIQYCGIGNITCYVIHHDTIKRPRTHYGYLAGKTIRPFVETFKFTNGDRCFMHSDGIDVIDAATLLNADAWQALENDETDHYLLRKNDDQTYVMLQF